MTRLSPLFALALSTLAPGAAAQGTPLDFARDVEPLLTRYCVRCHGPRKQKGEVRLDALDPDMVQGGDAEAWHSALDMINSGEMPPEKAKQLGDAERRVLVRWMSEGLRAAAVAKRGEVKTVLRRLNKAQYTHTLRDLLGVDVEFGRVLPDDAKSATGFSNNGEVLQASPLHLDTFEQVARRALELAIPARDKPAITRYRVRFGKDIGKGRVAARTGGYQSVPLSTDDFRVELLDEAGAARRPTGKRERQALDKVRRKISVGLRGSSADRFHITPEGMMLFGAVPHKEKAPKAWQGPSPNVKLEMQRVFPRSGDFVMRVRASRGYIPPMRRELLVPLDEAMPFTELAADGRVRAHATSIVMPASAAVSLKNLTASEDLLVSKDVPKDSHARYLLDVVRDGFYQVDLVHPVVEPDQMPQVRLHIAGRNHDMRPQVEAGDEVGARKVTTVCAAGLRKGRHQLRVGGKFFVGFSHLVVTPLPETHPLVKRLTADTQKLARANEGKTPWIRAFVGTRTDDGMDYKTFGAPQRVDAPLGAPRVYEFFGRLEDLPIPEPDTGDTEVLSGFMLLGLWNDHLVKKRGEIGPPLLVESIEFEAPFHPQWPPASQRAILFDSPWKGDLEVYTREVLEAFLARAFRRPLRAGESARYMDFWKSVRGDYARNEDALREVLVAALCSPNFLYMTEPRAAAGTEAISQHALATRLAYFLWNSPPDDALRADADAGALDDAALARHVGRMLDDARVARFVEAFAHEWLRLDRLEQIAVDVDRFPAFTRFVKRDMRLETLEFLRELIRRDAGLEALVDADFAMLNQNLAEFYGVPGVTGNHFRPVTLPRGAQRGGLLTQGSFLCGHSDGAQPHPIKRAVWFKKRILGVEPPPPPPNVPDLDPETPGFEKLTLKEQILMHRDKASCRDCHASIDPYGIAFERYNAVGLRETERKGRPIDASTTLPDGTDVDGVEALQRWLLRSQRATFERALAEHLFAWALGRDTHFSDEEEISRILTRVKSAGGTIRSLLREIVLSPSFRRN